MFTSLWVPSEPLGRQGGWSVLIGSPGVFVLHMAIIYGPHTRECPPPQRSYIFTEPEGGWVGRGQGVYLLAWEKPEGEGGSDRVAVQRPVIRSTFLFDPVSHDLDINFRQCVYMLTRIFWADQICFSWQFPAWLGHRLGAPPGSMLYTDARDIVEGARRWLTGQWLAICWQHYGMTWKVTDSWTGLYIHGLAGRKHRWIH